MIQNQLIGALTSKPYAFTARSWELRNVESIDVFDSTGSTIKLSTRGSSILRVLPKINDHLNEEWITDKVRFSYDALKFQRLTHCFKKMDDRFVKIQWNHVFSLFQNINKEHDFSFYSSYKTPKDVKFFIGSFVDLETLGILERLKYQSNNRISIISSNASSLCMDLRSDYLFKDLALVNNAKTCLLIGCNLRYEAPILNLKLRKNVVAKTLFVYSLGFYFKNNFSVKNVGNSLKKLKDFIEAKSFLNKKLEKDSLVVVGNSFLTMENGFSIFRRIRSLYNNTNILQSEASLSNFYESGLANTNRGQSGQSSIRWMLDEDKTKFLKSEATVYQGHHNDHNFSSSDIVLPSTLFSEKNSTFFNFVGIRQETKFVDSKILNTSVRDDRKILKNISGLDDHGFSMGSLDLNIHEPRHSLAGSSGLFFINNSFISNSMKDFYRNDSITRNSPVMALVSNRVNNKNSSFNEA